MGELSHAQLDTLHTKATYLRGRLIDPDSRVDAQLLASTLPWLR